MEQPTKTCPKCGSGNYEFRSRKKVPGENGQGEQTETKYRCKACGEEWRVRVKEQKSGEAQHLES